MKKSTNAWRIAAGYFAILGTVNFTATLFSGIHTIDFVLLGLGILPLLIKRKWFMIGYGFLGAFIFGYVVIATLASQINPMATTPIHWLLAGYALLISGIAASLLLFYAGLQTDDKHSFSLL